MAVESTLSAGAILASKRKIETKLCPVCKEEFEGIKKAIITGETQCYNKTYQKIFTVILKQLVF